MDGTTEVDAYMRALEHPLKAEMAAVRTIIMNANSKIAERIKWKAPSFYFKDDVKEDLAAFHPRARDFVQLILVFPKGLIDDRTGLLEGEWKDRRMAKFHDMADVNAKRAALEAVVNAWVALEENER